MNAKNYLEKANAALSNSQQRTALKYFLKAADLGDAEGHLQAGLLFLKGVESRSLIEIFSDSLRQVLFNTSDHAKNHFIAALKASHPLAYSEFQCAFRNESSPKDSLSLVDEKELFLYALKIEAAEGPRVAWRFFVRAADLGNTESQFRVAQAAQKSTIKATFPEGFNSIEQALKDHQQRRVLFTIHQDLNIAEKYYTMAADNGHLESQFCLVEIFVDERKRDLDGVKSDHYFRLIEERYERLDDLLKSRFLKIAEKQKDFFERIKDDERSQFYSEIKAKYTPAEPIVSPSKRIDEYVIEKSDFEKNKEAADAGNRNSQLKVAEIYKKDRRLDEALHYFKLAFFNTDPLEMEIYTTGDSAYSSDVPKRKGIQKQIDSVTQLISERSNPYSPNRS